MLTGTPRIHPAQCTRYRYAYSACRDCADVCPHAALELNDEGVVLDVARCRNCGLCDVSCPTGVFHCEALPDLEQLRALSTRERLTIACAPSGADGDVTVPCLAAFGPVALGLLVSGGVDVTLRGAGHCEACDHGATGAPLLEAQIAALDELLGLPGPTDEAHGRCTVDRGGGTTKPFDGGRRAFFRRALGYVEKAANAPVAAQSIDVPASAIRAGRHHLPIRHRVLDVLLRTRQRNQGTLRPDSLLFVADLEFAADGCTLCEACVRVCPTGALDVDESQQHWNMSFDDGRCVACGVCVEACQPGVLTLSPRRCAGIADGGRRRALHASDKRRCDTCNRPFLPLHDESRCRVCSDDDGDFAAIFG